MTLADIKVDEILAGKNWVLEIADGGEVSQAHVSEAFGFTPTDTGLFSAVVKFGDGSVHPALVVKSFPHGGDETDLFVHTKLGWLNLQQSGFMRAVGKYSHEVFPFEYFIGSPWKAGAKPAPDNESPHRKAFQDLSPQVVVSTPGTKRR